jgi:hypothetical protein
MSKLSSFRRHLKPEKVWLANQVAEEKIKIARQVVLERAKKDAEFAADVLKAVGENLPKEIKEACEASVARVPQGASEFNPEVTDAELQEAANKAVEEDLKPIVGGDLTHTLVPVQTDGGGEILVHETELPDYPTDGNEPRDGDEPPLDITEKLVQEEGPKVEKA